MVKHKCESCNKEHLVRQADLNRGWGRTCSKSCASSVKARKPGSAYRTIMNKEVNADELPTFQSAHLFYKK